MRDSRLDNGWAGAGLGLYEAGRGDLCLNPRGLDEAKQAFLRTGQRAVAACVKC